MVRAVLSAIAGYVGIGILVVFTDQLFNLLINGFNAKATPPLYYFVISLCTDSFYSFLGGYLCASIAKQTAPLATRILLIGGEVVGLISVIAFWHAQPHWFALALLIVFPPAVWAGSRLRVRGEPSAASV